MIGKLLLVTAIALLLLTAYILTSNNLMVEVQGKGVIVDEVRNTGEGLEDNVIDFNKPEKGYS